MLHFHRYGPPISIDGGPPTKTCMRCGVPKTLKPTYTDGQITPLTTDELKRRAREAGGLQEPRSYLETRIHTEGRLI